MKIKFRLKKEKGLPGRIRKYKLSKKAKWFLVVLVAAFILGGLIYRFKHWVVVALVDYKPVTRFELTKELERQGGKQVLETLINERLILQEAKRRRLEPTNAEINEKVDQIEEELKGQGMTLDDVLKLQGQSRSEFLNQVKIQVIIDKIIGEDVELSDEEVQQYFEDNQSFYPEGTKFEEVESELRDTLKQQKIGEKFQEWLQNLKDKAKINYFVSY
jgi:foldase protein PrsA